MRTTSTINGRLYVHPLVNDVPVGPDGAIVAVTTTVWVASNLRRISQIQSGARITYSGISFEMAEVAPRLIPMASHFLVGLRPFGFG